MTGVDEVALCPWEGQTLPIDHDCIGCPSPTGDACGVCPRDLADQTQDLAKKLRARALTYIRESCVRWVHARPDADQARPVEVRAWVQGHQAAYRVWGDLHGEVMAWRCDCTQSPRVALVDQCAHVAAVALCSGWPSAAAKPAPEPEEPS